VALEDGSVQALSSSSATDPYDRRSRFVDRLLAATDGAFDVVGAYFGIRLGLYDSLAADGPATIDELAERIGTNQRMVREWLE
jgi:hypothetical protein